MFHFSFEYLVIDAWGKLPSGILSGNFYEFGAFSQCFNIERFNELYETQYCLGYLIIGKGVVSRKLHQSDIVTLPNIFQTVDAPEITPRIAVSK